MQTTALQCRLLRQHWVSFEQTQWSSHLLKKYPGFLSSLSFCCLQPLLKQNLFSCCDKHPHTENQEQHSLNNLRCSCACCIKENNSSVTDDHLQATLYLWWKIKNLRWYHTVEKYNIPLEILEIPLKDASYVRDSDQSPQSLICAKMKKKFIWK